MQVACITEKQSLHCRWNLFSVEIRISFASWVWPGGKRTAKLQNTRPLFCISLNNKSAYCVIPRSLKRSDEYKWCGRVFWSCSKRTSESNYSGTPLYRHPLNTDTHTMDSLICTNSEKAHILLLKITCFIQTPG